MPPTVKPVKQVILIGILIICSIAAVLLLLRPSTPTPEQAFKAALKASLTTKGVTCQVDQTAPTFVSRQVVRLDLGGNQNLQSTTSLKRENTVVTTEQIDTKAATYVRYVSFASSQLQADESLPDYNKVLNVWTKSTPQKDELRMFDSTVLGQCVVPLANLSKAELAPLATELQNGRAFQTDFNRVRQVDLNGKPARVFLVKVQAEPYVILMKQVAKISGTSYLDQVKSSDYAKKTAEDVKFYIDLKTSKLLKIENTARKRTVTLSDYGDAPKLTIPTKTITPEELQKRLQGQ